MDANPENAFPEGIFRSNSVYIKTTLKTLLLTKDKLKNNVRFRKQRRNINFHVASFWRNNDHFDFAFFLFWYTKNFNWWLFCVENKSNNIFQNKKFDVLFILVFFPALFLQQFFPLTLYRVAYKWRMDRNTYQHVND